MKNRTLLDAFNSAFEGLIYAVRSQRNMKIHTIATILVLVASLVFRLNLMEVLMVFVAIALVVIAELFNTAIETVVDLHTQKTHPLAAIAKNVSAAAVLVAAFLAVILGFLVLYPKLELLTPKLLHMLYDAPVELTLIALSLTIVAVIVAKALTKRKNSTPLQGGMPSGHTALGTAAVTALTLINENMITMILGFLIVCLIGESRVTTKIHSWDEVIVGAILGFLITLLVFQLIR